MLKNTTSVFIFFLVFAFASMPCYAQLNIEIPAKTENLNDFSYNTYKGNLEKAIAEKNHFQIGIQLCNLGADKKIVYEHLRKGVLEDKTHCANVLYWHKNYVIHGFKVKPIALDTNEWRKVCKICQDDKAAVAEFKRKEEIDLRKAERREQARLKDIDSTKLDKALMATLQAIYNDDQRYRRNVNNETWKLQEALDAENLAKVEEIIRSRPYPSYKEVGINLDIVVFLVVHHQSDVAVKKKHLPYFEAAVANGALSEGFLSAYINAIKASE